MQLKIREMVLADMPKILELEFELFGSDAWTEDMYVMEINQHEAYVLTDPEDQIIGYLCAWIVLDECMITNIGIRKEYQGKGLGKYLLSSIMTEKIQTGARNFFLEVRMSNVSAIKLYESMGYKYLSVRKNYYDNPVEDAYLMGLFV